MITVEGFTNIEKERIELNVSQPRNYSNIFRYLVHETIHMCILDESKNKEPALVESIVEENTKKFFDIFSKDIESEEKVMIEDLETFVDIYLKRFSEADTYLTKIMKIDRAKVVVATMMGFFDAVLKETVVVNPK